MYNLKIDLKSIPIKLNSEYYLVYSPLEFSSFIRSVTNFRSMLKLFASYELLIFASLDYHEN